jgi:spore germination cell wall hydrolase CwlJ-like protein
MILEAALMCLALNIFHEARGEPVAGQFAVAMVTLNRAGWDKKKVCKEVYRFAQFSWTLDPEKVDFKPSRKSPEWKTAVAVADLVLKGRVKDMTYGATYYHAAYVRPDWSRDKRFVAVNRIGQHIFYRSAA